MDLHNPAGAGRRQTKSASKSASRSATKKGPALAKRAQPKAMAGSRSATKSQAVPAKSRSSAGSRTAARSSFGASRSRSTTQARSASRSRSQGSMMNPIAWLSSLETTLTSPQARAVMAEALGRLQTCWRSRRAASRDRAAEHRKVGTPIGRGKPGRRDRRCSADGGRSGCHRSRRGGRDERPRRFAGRRARQ